MIYAIIIGGLAGWLAGIIMKGGGLGLFANILLGIIGGFIGRWLFHKLGINFLDGIEGDLVKGVIGAIVLLFIAGLLKKK